jgi:hypothetical protein
MYVNKYLAVGLPSVLVAPCGGPGPTGRGPAGAWIAIADSPWWNTACTGLSAATRPMPRRLLSRPAVRAARHAAIVGSWRRGQRVLRCLPTPMGSSGTAAAGPPDPQPKPLHSPRPPSAERISSPRTATGT